MSLQDLMIERIVQVVDDTRRDPGRWKCLAVRIQSDVLQVNPDTKAARRQLGSDNMITALCVAYAAGTVSDRLLLELFEITIRRWTVQR